MKKTIVLVKWGVTCLKISNHKSNLWLLNEEKVKQPLATCGYIVLEHNVSTGVERGCRSGQDKMLTP